MKKDAENFRSLNLVHVFCVLEACMAGINVRIDQLSLWHSFGSLWLHLAVAPRLVFLKCWNLHETTGIIPVLLYYVIIDEMLLEKKWWIVLVRQVLSLLYTVHYITAVILIYMYIHLYSADVSICDVNNHCLSLFPVSRQPATATATATPLHHFHSHSARNPRCQATTTPWTTNNVLLTTEWGRGRRSCHANEPAGTHFQFRRSSGV